MVEHRYRDNAETASARGQQQFVKRSGQRKTTSNIQESIKFNSHVRTEKEREARRKTFSLFCFGVFFVVVVLLLSCFCFVSSLLFVSSACVSACE